MTTIWIYANLGSGTNALNLQEACVAGLDIIMTRGWANDERIEIL